MKFAAWIETQNMFHYGLTGGIGTGKSTVGRMFADLGVVVVDADRLARELLDDGGHLAAEIIDMFPDCAKNRRAVSREKLAELVFTNPEARRRLEDLLHPAIWNAYLEKVQAYAKAGSSLAMIEAAVLLESRTPFPLCGLILVTAPKMVRLKRLSQRGDLVSDQIEARMAVQMPDYEKLLFADHLIENHADLDATRLRVEQVLGTLRHEIGEV